MASHPDPDRLNRLPSTSGTDAVSSLGTLGRELLAQFELLQFAGGGAGQFGAEFDAFGALVPGQMYAAVGDEFVGCDRGGGHDQGGDQFTPLLVGDADDRGFADGVVQQQGVLDLDGGHVLSPVMITSFLRSVIVR